MEPKVFTNADAVRMEGIVIQARQVLRDAWASGGMTPGMNPFRQQLLDQLGEVEHYFTARACNTVQRDTTPAPLLDDPLRVFETRAGW